MPIDPLPNSPATLDTDSMRNKINELIGNNASVTVSNSPPTGPAEGDLWFDEGSAAMYVYVAAPTNAWIQTNPASTGGGGGAGGSISLVKYEESATLGKLATGYTSGETVGQFVTRSSYDYNSEPSITIDSNNTYIYFGMRDLTNNHNNNTGLEIPVYPSGSTTLVHDVPVFAGGDQPGYLLRAFIVGSKLWVASAAANQPTRFWLRFATLV